MFFDFELELDDQNLQRAEQLTSSNGFPAQQTLLDLITPEEYNAEDHSEGWFIARAQDKNHPETILRQYSAEYYYNRGNYQAAKSHFIVAMDCAEHNSTHMCYLADCILRCQAKLHELPDERVVGIYENHLKNFADQLQFWLTIKDCLLVASDPSSQHKYINVVILLCSFFDVADFWLAFTKNPHVHAGPNFLLYARASALNLLVSQFTSAPTGLGKDALARKLKNEMRIIQEAGYSRNELEEAKQYMTAQSRGSKADVMNDINDVEVLVHQVRSALRPCHFDKAQHTMISHFRSRYAKMFEGMLFEK